MVISIYLFVVCAILFLILIGYFANSGVIAEQEKEITFKDPNLKAEAVYSGLEFPTSMAFLGANDILVLEKDSGTVHRILNGKLLPQPLLDVPVANKAERGMLGIAVAKHDAPGSTYVFLYYTKSGGGKDGDDESEGIQPQGNHLYRYELVGNKLVNPKLLLSLPAVPGPDHNGGKLLIGPDENVYLVVGDIGGYHTLTQNFQNETTTIGSVIYRISQNGEPVGNVLGNGDPLNKFYAYGIRNSFGLDFDPLTKKLWDTENGPNFGDEINLVEPGFNSGWREVQGIWKPAGLNRGEHAFDTDNNKNLTSFNGKGKYSSPEFTWNFTAGLTAIKFLNSTKTGNQYENDIFVGDINNGNIYHFELNKSRTGLLLNTSVLSDLVLEQIGNDYDTLFAVGFGGILDMQVGPDGYLYVLSLTSHFITHQEKATTGGAIYRIQPDHNTPVSPL